MFRFCLLCIVVFSQFLFQFTFVQAQNSVAGFQEDYANRENLDRFTPLKRIRVVVHVFYEDDGTGYPVRPGEPLTSHHDRQFYIRHYIIDGGQEPVRLYNIRSINYVYHHSGDTSWYYPPMKQDVHETDTRIVFHVDTLIEHHSSYYYRNIKVYNTAFAQEFYDKHVVMTKPTDDRDTSIDMPVLSADQRSGAMHVLFARGPENGKAQGQACGLGCSQWCLMSHFDNFTQGMLAHELGHMLGLRHTFEGGKDRKNDTDCMPRTPLGSTNNVMDQARTPHGLQLEFDSCQAGTMHYNIMRNAGNLQRVLIADHCTYHPEATIRIGRKENIHWKDRKYLQGDVIVGRKAVLTIDRLVSLPEGAKIYLRKGAKINFGPEGTLVNLCNWKNASSYSLTRKDAPPDEGLIERKTKGE